MSRVLPFLALLLFAGCQPTKSGDLRLRIHDSPQRGINYSTVEIKKVIAWRLNDSPGGKLKIFLGPHPQSQGIQVSGDYGFFDLERDEIEQIERTGNVVLVFDDASTKTLPVRISNKRYSRNDPPRAFEE